MTDSTPKLVPLYRRTELVAYALVDAQDYEKVKDIAWALTSNGYAQCRSRKFKDAFYMHRFIMGATDSELLIDHKNHIRTDNRRANLRGCNALQNAMNARRTGKFGFRGVAHDRRKDRYRASIAVAKERYNVGGLATPEQAARVYDHLAQHFHGEFAILNFPEDIQPIPDGFIDRVIAAQKAEGNRSLTTEQAQEIRQMRADNVHVDTIAAQFNVRRETIYRVLRGIGYSNPGQ